MKELITADTYRLVKEVSNIPRKKVRSSYDVNKYALNIYGEDIDVYESFYIILLNQSNNIVGFQKISQGSIDGTMVDIRLIAKYAIDSLAVSVILVHNHPSGNTTPSKADKYITAEIKKGLDVLKIKLFDHIIVTNNNGYFSFADSKLIED